MFKIVLIILPLLAISTEIFAEQYIRSDATGRNDGSDWANAYTNIPDSLMRGEIYYIADGYYPGPHVFDDIESEDSWITIKKATNADHGSNQFWQSSFGDGQAVLGNIMLRNDNYEIDGVTGGGYPDWTTGFGIKVRYETGFTYPMDQKLVSFIGALSFSSDQPQNIRFSHIDFEHGGTELDLSGDIFWTYPASSFSNGVKNVYIGYSYLHDCPRNQILTYLSEKWTVENSFFARNFSSASRHSEAWQDFGGRNMVVRNNIWEDITGTGYIALKKNQPLEQSNWMIYGNVFYYTENYDGMIGGEGVIGDTSETDSATRNIFIFNNTIYNVYGWNVGFNFANGTNENIYAFNNLFVSNPSNLYIEGSSAIGDYNFYYEQDRFAASHCSGAHDVILSEDPLSAPQLMDFTLRKELDSALPIKDFLKNNPAFEIYFQNQDYMHDYQNQLRGTGKNWDPGALEFTSQNILHYLPALLLLQRNEADTE